VFLRNPVKAELYTRTSRAERTPIVEIIGKGWLDVAPDAKNAVRKCSETTDDGVVGWKVKNCKTWRHLPCNHARVILSASSEEEVPLRAPDQSSPMLLSSVS
jgi:hypothetical protein